jgi:hypothetical protein
MIVKMLLPRASSMSDSLDKEIQIQKAKYAKKITKTLADVRAINSIKEDLLKSVGIQVPSLSEGPQPKK